VGDSAFSKTSADFLCNATTRYPTAKWSGQADSARKTGRDSPFKAVLTVVESDHGWEEEKVGQFCAMGRFWSAISPSGHVRTRRRAPGIGGIL
jgi:hypothetical protein